MSPFNNNVIQGFFGGRGTYPRSGLGSLGDYGGYDAANYSSPTASGSAGVASILTSANVTLASQAIGTALTAENAQNIISENKANADALLAYNQQRAAAGLPPVTSITQSTLTMNGPMLLLAGAVLVMMSGGRK